MNMKIMKCAIKGILWGFILHTIFSLILSLRINTGEFYTVLPALVKDYKNELCATIIQICAFAWLAFFVEIANYLSKRLILREKWQMLGYIILLTLGQLPMAIIYHWNERIILGIFSYIIISSIITGILYVADWKRLKEDIDEIRTPTEILDKEKIK